MTYPDECCTTCIDCGERWCRDADVSPGEAIGICPNCYDRAAEVDREARRGCAL